MPQNTLGQHDCCSRSPTPASSHPSQLFCVETNLSLSGFYQSMVPTRCTGAACDAIKRRLLTPLNVIKGFAQSNIRPTQNDCLLRSSTPLFGVNGVESTGHVVCAAGLDQFWLDLPSHAQEGKHKVRYARFVQRSEVEVSSGRDFGFALDLRTIKGFIGIL